MFELDISKDNETQQGADETRRAERRLMFSFQKVLELNLHTEQLLELLVFRPGSVEVLPCIGLASLAGFQSPHFGCGKDCFKLLSWQRGYALEFRDTFQLRISQPVPVVVV